MSATQRATVLSPDSSADRILAIDYGRKRIGLAVSDPTRVTARPLVTLERTNRRDDLRRLRDLVREHKVKRILVGRPVHLDGTESEMAAEAARFARRVEQNLGLPVEMVEERLTSWEAQQIISSPGSSRRAKPAQVQPSGARRKRVQEALDAVAAAVILRDYLEREHALTAAAQRASAHMSEPEETAAKPRVRVRDRGRAPRRTKD
jgi:putative Holliday junction resolvase